MSYTILRAARRFGEPSDPVLYRLTAEDVRQVRAVNVSPLANPTDTVGVGSCEDETTHRKCEFFRECMAAVVRYAPLTCRVKAAAVDRYAAEQARLAQRDATSEQMLTLMREHGAPVTLAWLVERLGIDMRGERAVYHAARGAFHHLVHSERIVAVAGSERIKVWAIAEEHHA